jgi:aspartyl-tRNA(Asn)/glutamyl-tRNA(Gln) amidotransferase subunit A
VPDSDTGARPVTGPSSRRDFLTAAAAGVAAALTPAALAPVPPAGAAPARQAKGTAGDALAWLTLRQASEALQRKEVTSVELTRACLERIDRHRKTLNAWITVTADRALDRAREMDAEIRAGSRRGPLHGIPFGLKDNIDTEGVRTTAASALFADRIPAADAEVARRLREAGTVLLGKHNLHEFAMGGSSAVTYYGPVRNPWKTDASPGGSSGGTAAAVAAAHCYGGLGTDTGGSIRCPAGYCGIVGLKPTNGRASNRGIAPLCWTFDTVGPMCRTVEDAALVLQAIAGYDRLDVSTIDVPVPDYAAALESKIAGLRVGVPRAMFFDHLDPGVDAAIGEALEAIGALGATVRDVTLPALVTLPDSTWSSEIFAYHSQFFPRSASAYQIPTRRFLESIAATSAADYVLGLREVARLRREADRVFEGVDLLITPANPKRTWSIEESLRRDESEKPLPPFLDVTWQFNVLGLPSISVPCGTTGDGVPVGLAISGPRFGEARVLALAHAYERAGPWHGRRPPVRPAA